MGNINKYSDDNDDNIRELMSLFSNDKFVKFLYNIEVMVYVIKIDGTKTMIMLN